MFKWILVISFVVPSALFARDLKVDYQNLSYTIKHDKKKFVYTDKHKTKTYNIKDCNRSQFDLFWANFELNKEDISSLNKVKNIKPLSYMENKQKTKKINPHGKLGKFLQDVPKQVFAFDVNEKVKCAK